MKDEIIRPEYEGNSIVNLISSIKTMFGGKSAYSMLKDFDLSPVLGRNVIFLVIDGLGYDFLVSRGKGGYLFNHLAKRITSVFPSTTAAALTSLATGVAPQQHGLTGWYMYLREIGAVTAVLPFRTRAGNLSLEESRTGYDLVCDQKSIFNDMDASCYLVQRKDYSDSGFSRLIAKGANMLCYTCMNGFFLQIKRALNTGKKRKFIFAYWDEFDSICHEKGSGSRSAQIHFYELEKRISRLADYLKKRNTVILLTADHGFIDTKEKENIINLKDHSALADTLLTPLCGDPRVAQCYVRSEKMKFFEEYVKKYLSDCCYLFKSKELIKKDFFGLFKPDRKLGDRVGDYILIMKKNCIIRDTIPGEEAHKEIGNHGGTSAQEMYVPLIYIE